MGIPHMLDAPYLARALQLGLKIDNESRIYKLPNVMTFPSFNQHSIHSYNTRIMRFTLNTFLITFILLLCSVVRAGIDGLTDSEINAWSQHLERTVRIPQPDARQIVAHNRQNSHQPGWFEKMVNAYRAYKAYEAFFTPAQRSTSNVS